MSDDTIAVQRPMFPIDTPKNLTAAKVLGFVNVLLARGHSVRDTDVALEIYVHWAKNEIDALLDSWPPGACPNGCTGCDYQVFTSVVQVREWLEAFKERQDMPSGRLQ